MVMPYRDLYQPPRRRTATPDQAASSPQPNGVSFVEHMRRLHPVQVDASAGLNDAERRQVKEIQRLMAAGQWGLGNIIPNKLLAAVFDGSAPEGQPFSLQSASDPLRSIAAQVDKGLSLRASLATDRDQPRNLATDQVGRPRNDLSIDHRQYHRPTMSYKLSQVMGDYELLDEDSFDESMQAWGVTEPRDRIGLKTEATALGMMRPRGQAPKLPARYIQAPHVANPRLPHFVSKDSPAAEKSTAGRPDTPGKKHVKTIQACTAEGYCAYDGTSIDL